MSAPDRWTPAYDRIFDPSHHLADDQACKRFAWLDLCHMASWKDQVRILGSTVVALERGELLASIRFLADRWSWSRKKVANYLAVLHHPAISKLETVRETPKGTVYRIAKYDTYANPGDSAGATVGARWEPGGSQVGAKVHTSTTGSVSKDTSPTAAAVGEFLGRTGAEWRLDRGIAEWCSEIGREPKYAGADIPYEIGRCTDWHVGQSKTPKAPDLSIRRWLEKAAGDKRKRRNGGVPHIRLQSYDRP